MVATTGVLGSRLGALDDFAVISKVVVYFGNGKASLSPNDKAALRQLAEQARDLPGYRVQVEGYASAVGSSLNAR